jgi:hypothetical protein
MSIAQIATGLDFCIIMGEKKDEGTTFQHLFGVRGDYIDEVKLHLIRIERPEHHTHHLAF